MRLGKIIALRKIVGQIRRKLKYYKDIVQFGWPLFLFGIRNYLLNDRPIVINICGQSLRMTPKGTVAFELWRNHGYGQSPLQFFLGILQPGMTFVDIGSNSGFFAVAAAKKIGPGKAYALEPSRSIFEVLEENIHLNGLSNVIAVQVALGDRIGQAILQVNSRFRDLFNTIGRPVRRNCQVVARECVPITTLDVFIQTQGILTIDVMKVDVEGAELLVLYGAKNLLQRRDAPLILYESGDCTKGFDYHPVETMWLLDEYGYSLFVLDTKSYKIVPIKPEHGYNVMIVAVKRDHSLLSRLQGDF